MTNVERIALNWSLAAHTPNDPSYRAFVAETIAQYALLQQLGVHVKWVSDTLTGTAQDLFDGLDNERTLTIAVDGSPFLPAHPLADYVWLRPSPSPNKNDGGTQVRINSLFRAVHDYFGHYRTRSPFTFKGEVAAWRTHNLMYSGEARRALYGETIGQLCYGEVNGGFVPVQKCALIPFINPTYSEVAK